MKKNSANNPITIMLRLLGRYNLVIFIVIAACGLVAAIMILNNIINMPYENEAANNASVTSFDQTTINSLTKLEPSSKNTVYKTMPAGRNNPFSE